MIRFSRWFNRLYAILIRLYPSDFRDEFVEEMTAVCAEAITEAVGTGPARLALACLREFLGLLLGLARENWRSKMGANDDDNARKKRRKLAQLHPSLAPVFWQLDVGQILHNLPLRVFSPHHFLVTDMGRSARVAVVAFVGMADGYPEANSERDWAVHKRSKI